MPLFSVVNYSFVTKALRAVQRKYQEQFTSEWWSEQASERVSEFAIVTNNPFITLHVFCTAKKVLALKSRSFE